MQRTFGDFLCVLLWAILVAATVLGLRSRQAAETLVYHRLVPRGDLLQEQNLSARSEGGEVRIAVGWGTRMNLGAQNAKEYGPTGWTHTVQHATAHPTAEQPSASLYRAGFGIENGQYPWGWSGPLSERWVGLILPYWFIGAVSLIVPIRWLIRTRRRMRNESAGRCTGCDYDLRASSGRCPECGRVPTPVTRRARLQPRIALASLVLIPLVVAPSVHSGSLLNPIVDPITVTPGISFAASPTVWAPAKAPMPKGFIPYAEVLAGTTITLPMVPIPGGTFRMGSPNTEKDRRPDEGPTVEVTVEPFYMGQFEVTQAEYDEFRVTYSRLAGMRLPVIPKEKWSDAVTYPTPLYELEAGPILDRMGRGAGYPAVSMSQYSARQFTRWLSGKTGRFYRLPAEAEWEYACRAGSTTAYYFGDDPRQLQQYGWFFDNSETTKSPDGSYHKVGMKKPNKWGLHDMYGNVAEWVIDGYSANAYSRSGEARISSAEALHWPVKRYPRVIRGGGWSSEAADCRSAARGQATKELNVYDPALPKSPYWETNGFWVGFRVVCPMREPSEAEKNRFWGEEDPYVQQTLDADRAVREPVPPYP